MILPSFQVGRYRRINSAGTTLVDPGTAVLLGVFISSAVTGATLTVNDGPNQVARVSLTDAMRGQFLQMPFRLNNDLIVVTTGTLDITVDYLPF